MPNRLVHIGSATIPYDQAALDDISDVARRHHGGIVLQSEEGAGRTFARWDMAYEPFADLSAGNKDGFFGLLTLRQSPNMPVAEDDPRPASSSIGFPAVSPTFPWPEPRSAEIFRDPQPAFSGASRMAAMRDWRRRAQIQKIRKRTAPLITGRRRPT